MTKQGMMMAGVTVALLATTERSASAADDLPKRPEFARYEPMLNRSPFAVATAVAAPPAVSNFAKDLYVANAARSPNGDLVTVASSADKNLKLYLTTAQSVDGYSISNIEWSERVGATKVTIAKDGQFATIGFNQALLSAPMAANVPPPMQVPQPMQVTQPQVQQPQQPGAMPPMQPGGQGFGAPNPPPGMIKPAPIPMLPTPPPRVRTVIPRNPNTPVPTPAPEAPADQ